MVVNFNFNHKNRIENLKYNYSVSCDSLFFLNNIFLFLKENPKFNYRDRSQTRQRNLYKSIIA